MKIREISVRAIILTGIGLLCACGGNSTSGSLPSNTVEMLVSAEDSENENTQEQWEKGYDLPVTADEQKEAETDCETALELTAEIYRQADKGNASNVVLSSRDIVRMKEKLSALGAPVTGGEPYPVMENWREMEDFLLDAGTGKAGTVILYRIQENGSLVRLKFIYDGTDMYVLAANISQGRAVPPAITYISYTRIKEWRYTEKGYFCYKICVPEPPEVSEIIDGSYMVRVKPLSKECREISEMCVLPLGYQGNNLLRSNWDMDNLKGLDYNGVYEYLYEIKHGSRPDPENDPYGIPAEEFEQTVMDFLPVRQKELREWAVFDEEHQSYPWERLGCGNYVLNYFGNSIPEVTYIRENEDGTLTLTVDAVCQMILCDDALITHELTVRLSDDGAIRYLGNQILDDGILDIPEYQFRIEK